MRKERKAQVITITVLALAVAAAVVNKSGWRAFGVAGLAMPAAKTEPTPQDAIYAALDAARDGDVKKYLAGYTGQMLASLEQALKESTPEGFARSLRDSNTPVKGIAITEPQALTEREVKVRVEFVYQDRNEAQTMYLEKVGAEWKIARVDTAEHVKTLVPYGTPVQ